MRILTGFFLASVVATDVMASCANVSVITRQPLEIGIIRPMPQAHGFVELDPQEGMSFSHGNAAHDSGFGEGQVTITGLAGTTVTIGVEVLAEYEDRHPNIEMSEVIVRHGVEDTRIGIKGGEFQVTLPKRGTPEGLAKTSVGVGAVMRYQNPRASETVHYKLILSCLETAYAF